jgi:two-component system, LytTR family, response regulator
MNCIIVDDDDLTRLEVEQFVKQTPLLNLVGSFASAKEALTFSSTNKPQLIFLDIMMPEMSGLEFIQYLNEQNPLIILMTVERDYAIEAFNYNVTDFLVKPLSYERFIKAIAKAKSHIDHARNENISSKFIFAKVHSELIKINTDEINFIEAVGNYISIHTGSARHIVHSTMKSVLEKLSDKDFIRVHHSYIVRVDKIQNIEGNTLTVDKTLIPVSRAYKDSLMSRLNLL